MNLNNKLAPHESFDIHELLVEKTVAATKSATMVALVKDEELKAIMQQDLANGQKQIEELRDLLQQSVLVPIDSNNISSKETIIPEY